MYHPFNILRESRYFLGIRMFCKFLWHWGIDLIGGGSLFPPLFAEQVVIEVSFYSRPSMHTFLRVTYYFLTNHHFLIKTNFIHLYNCTFIWQLYKLLQLLLGPTSSWFYIFRSQPQKSLYLFNISKRCHSTYWRRSQDSSFVLIIFII